MLQKSRYKTIYLCLQAKGMQWFFNQLFALNRSSIERGTFAIFLFSETREGN